MTARDCMKGKIGAGRVSKRAGARILQIMTEQERLAAAGDTAGAEEAARQAQLVAARDAARKQAIAAGSARAQSNIQRFAADYDAAVKDLRAQGKAPVWMRDERKTNMGSALASLFTRDPSEIGGRWDNVDMLAQTLRGEAHAQMADAIEALRPKLLGLKAETLREAEVLKALHGESATPEGRAIADQFSKTKEGLRQKFNAAAGYEAIPARKDWRIGNPTFEPAKVGAMKPEEFVRQMSGLLDRGKMIDYRTGQPLSDVRLAEVLKSTYEDARMGGAEGQPNAGYVGDGPLSDRRAASRVFAYKDSASWLKAKELFGDSGGVFDAMMRDISGITHDTAIMRVLGPDPKATLRFMHSMLDGQNDPLFRAGEPGDAKSSAEAVRGNRVSDSSISSAKNWVDTLFAHMTGEAGVSTNPELARKLAAGRHYLMAAQLGSAIARAVPSDLVLTMMTARFNGLPVTSLMKGLVENMARGGTEIRSARLGLVADTMIHGASGVDRYMGETLHTGLPQKMSTVVIRATGHRLWTALGRDTYAMEAMGHLADAVTEGKSFAALDPPVREAFERYGVTPEDWAKLKDVPIYEPAKGAQFLRPMDVRAAGHEDLANSLMRMIRTEMHYTAIEGDAYTRAIQYGRNQPGSLSGETARAFWQYKSWPMTIIYSQLARGIARGFDGRRLSHLGALVIAMTIAGMVSTQVQQITLGRNPLNMDPGTPEGRQAWLKAMVMGGGLGLFSDIAFSDQHSTGQSLLATVGGPLGGAIDDALGYARKNIGRMNRGEPTDWLGDAYWTGSRYIPGANMIFYRLPLQREVLDQVGRWADPRAEERFQRSLDWARRDFHQDYWSKPGDASFSRGPNFGAMFGQ